jgi:uncharacterized membrane-anchored protein
MTFKIHWTKIKIAALVVIVVQLITLAVFVTSEYAVTSQDRTIYLHINPVDPTDFFKGDYVILDYDISTINTYFYSNNDSQTFSPNQQVYVLLSNYSSSKTHFVESYGDVVFTKKPTFYNKGGLGVYIKGIISSATPDCNYNYYDSWESESSYSSSSWDDQSWESYDSSSSWSQEYSSQSSKDWFLSENRCNQYNLKMEYGIEQYYVEQGKGREIEEAIRQNSNNAYAITKVDKNGNIRVVGLEINGVRY